jgi:signal transduction histidine kinase
VFATIAERVGDVIGLPLVVVWRYESDETGTVISAWSELRHPFEPGSRWPLDGGAGCALISKAGRPARIEDLADVDGTIADAQRNAGMRACAGAPIIVDGVVWGAIAVLSADRTSLPDQIEHQLAEITKVLTIAISNSARRDELTRLADEQAALRRVATLVARGTPPPEVFSAVAREVGLLLGVHATYLARYELGGTAIGVATWAAGEDDIPIGRQVTLEGDSVVGIVSRTGRPARVDCYAHVEGAAAELVRKLGLGSSVGAPIVVEQRLWGVLIVAGTQAGRPLPPDTESRVEAFTELVATAISNAESRIEIARLAEEQAALRRVATLVARGVPEAKLFGAAIQEIATLFGADAADMIRYDADGTVTRVACWSAVGDRSWPDPRSSLVTPILVDGRLWGALGVHAMRTDRFPLDTESRLQNFTELIATAISNIQARCELAASRARIVEAGDAERRRVVRDLHDGAQQRLIHTVLTLKMGLRATENGQQVDVRAVMAQALEDAQHATEALRELAHGVLPAALTHGGLRTAINGLASLMPVPVDTCVPAGRFPATVEATAYFTVAEALTNIAKHSRARRATVTACVEGRTLRIRVRDDGVGGARADGSGLLGLADRLTAVGGQLRVESPADGGTLIAADLPLPG